jgi:hypothetical protein
MATLTTNQKARIVATDGVGNVVNPAGAIVTSSDPAVLGISESGGWWAVGLTPGESTVTFTSTDGRSGTLAVTVSLEPLTVTLGDPEPR